MSFFPFYTLANNSTRTETIEVARELDDKCSKAWLGHPCMDVVANFYYFDRKVSKALQVRMLSTKKNVSVSSEYVNVHKQVVGERIGLNLKGFDSENKKRKFLVKALPDDEVNLYQIYNQKDRMN